MSADAPGDTEHAGKNEDSAPTGDTKPPSPNKITSTLSGLLSGEKFPKNDNDKNVPFSDDRVELSNKKKRSPCPWQIQPPPRPFKKARYAWQIKNYEHTVARMRKALAQQPPTSSMSKSSSCSDISPESDDSKHCSSSAPHYPGLYNNLPAAYSSSFYNPLLRWSKTASAASGVDIPVNRMLQNLFFSGNEPTSGLHPLLMMSLAEGNAAAFNENVTCDDLPREGAPLQLSDVPGGIGVGSPGMQSPPTSDYDSSSDEASLGDDLMPESQMMSHLPPSYPTMQQQQHLMNSPQPQHYLSNAQNTHQQMLHQHQNTLSCAQFPHMNAMPPRCDSPMDVPMSRRMTHIPEDPPSPHLHYDHHSPDHPTPEANLAFHNAMMNCPLSMTNRHLFSLQLHNFCERMQASNNFFPFNQSYQQYRNSCARVSEYVDEESSLTAESTEPVIDKEGLSGEVDAGQGPLGRPSEDSGVEANAAIEGRGFAETRTFCRGETNERVLAERNSARITDATGNDDNKRSALLKGECFVPKSANQSNGMTSETLELSPSKRCNISNDAMQCADSESPNLDKKSKNLRAEQENVCQKMTDKEAEKSLPSKAALGMQNVLVDNGDQAKETEIRSPNEDRIFLKQVEVLKSEHPHPSEESEKTSVKLRSEGLEGNPHNDTDRQSPSMYQCERGSSNLPVGHETQTNESDNCEKPSNYESGNRAPISKFSVEIEGAAGSAEEVAKCENSPVLKCKLEASDDTGDSCSLASFSPKCLNCVSGCDDCSRNLSDKTIESPNSRLTLLTCSCVIAKQCTDDASIAPAVSARESVDRSLGPCDSLIEVTSRNSDHTGKASKTGSLKDSQCETDFDECSCAVSSSRIHSCCSASKVDGNGKVRQTHSGDSRVGSADEKTDSPTNDSTDTKASSDKTASALVHHICDNNNDKYFLDQTFHVAMKQGLGYQKA